MTIEGRAALVTGAGGAGMGRSIALTLARDGADIVLGYRKSREATETVADAVRAMGRRATLTEADITDPAGVDALVGAGVEAFGRVDIAVCSAGGVWKPQDITQIEPEHLRSVIGSEIESVYSVLRAVLPGMRERGWGRIVLIGGHMADDWRFGPPDAPLDYPMGKAARHWLVRTLAPMERTRGITINAVAPGPTRRFTREEALAAVRGELPTEDGNTPQTIADVVAFLCSDAGTRVTGAVIPVPGSRPV